MGKIRQVAFRGGGGGRGDQPLLRKIWCRCLCQCLALANQSRLKGNSHQILLSEMSLPGVEVLIEKLLPKILGRLGKENPSKR